MTFASLGLLDPLLKALEGLGHGTPTPIQAQAIPPALKGRDLLAAAQTGTGKTAGFALPLLQRLTLEGPQVAANSVRALVWFRPANWPSRSTPASATTASTCRCVPRWPTVGSASTRR